MGRHSTTSSFITLPHPAVLTRVLALIVAGAMSAPATVKQVEVARGAADRPRAIAHLTAEQQQRVECYPKLVNYG